MKLCLRLFFIFRIINFVVSAYKLLKILSHILDGFVSLINNLVSLLFAEIAHSLTTPLTLHIVILKRLYTLNIHRSGIF